MAIDRMGASRLAGLTVECAGTVNATVTRRSHEAGPRARARRGLQNAATRRDGRQSRKDREEHESLVDLYLRAEGHGEHQRRT
jgi:hypothetical protein